MLRFILLLLLSLTMVRGPHFDGGTITWQPIYPNINSSIVPIIITQSYSWSASLITCANNVPISTAGRATTNTNLTCIAGCSTDGGYSSKQINILTDCQTVSSAANIMRSQRSVNTSLTAGAHFSISYAGSAWPSLNYPTITGLLWSIVSSIDLRLRPDGLINTAPVATVVSPQYALVNHTTLITIPVQDDNVGDYVRCRWANNTVINECGGICYPASLPTGTTLSACTISFLGLTPGVWYGVAIQVEDFINSTTLIPMSSVPVQFLIFVMNQTACGLPPLILPLQTCFDVQVGVTIHFNMSAMTQCNPNISSINSIFVTSNIIGMNITNLVNSSTNKSVSYVTFTWTPSISQLGSQQLCVLAYTSERLQSSQYCVTFNVISSPPPCFTTTTSTTTTTTKTTSTTSTTKTTSTTSTTQTTTTTSTTKTTSTTSTTKTTTTTSTTKTTSTTSTRKTSTSTSSTTSIIPVAITTATISGMTGAIPDTDIITFVSTDSTTMWTESTFSTIEVETVATVSTTAEIETVAIASTTMEIEAISTGSTTAEIETVAIASTTIEIETVATTPTTIEMETVAIGSTTIEMETVGITLTSTVYVRTTTRDTVWISVSTGSIPSATFAMINTLLVSNDSKQRSMWLALFLPVVLLSLCCSCFTLYYWYWTSNLRRVRRRKRIDPLQRMSFV